MNPPGSTAPARAMAGPDFNVRDFGAAGDGRTLDTTAINRAIRAAETVGGGTVVLPAGDYLSHSIRLCSHLTLWIGSGARLIAADPPPAGQPGGYDAPEEGPPNVFQDFGHSRFRNSLIWGDGLEHVTIAGEGIIFGRGLSRGNGRVALPVGEVVWRPTDRMPDVLEADGPIEPLPGVGAAGPFGYPHGRDVLPAGVGNKAIALRGCRHVTVRDLTLLHAGHFAILAAGCDHVSVSRVFIDTNRDGIDIDACVNVRIDGCSVNSPWDDGICIKSSCGYGGLRPVENVIISNCYVSGFKEGTLYDGTRSRELPHRGGPIGRIKLGTEGSGGFRAVTIANCVFEFCRGLALEQVDGAEMTDIVVSNLTLRDVVNAPLFIRRAARLRSPAARAPGVVDRITISQVVAYNVAVEHGIFLAGLPGHPIDRVSLSGIQLFARGGGTAEDALRAVPEMPRDYPEPYLFGRTPAWGLYARHVGELQLRDVSLRLLSPDARPAVVLEDVATLSARNCDGLADGRR